VKPYEFVVISQDVFRFFQLRSYITEANWKTATVTVTLTEKYR